MSKIGSFFLTNEEFLCEKRCCCCYKETVDIYTQKYVSIKIKIIKIKTTHWDLI